MLPLMEINNLNWDLVKAQFEEDFKAAPSSSSVIQKLPEIRQKDDETVIDYVSRVAEILLDLKAKTDISEITMQLQLSDVATAGYTGMDEAVKNLINKEIKKQAQTLTFNLISGFHLIAGFKADIRAGLMKKQKELINMAMIKKEVMEIEAIIEEGKRKSNSVPMEMDINQY